MARKIPIILKEIAQIKNSEFIKESHKPQLLQKLKAEIDEITGQTELPELTEGAPGAANTGGVPPAPQAVSKGAKTAS